MISGNFRLDPDSPLPTWFKTPPSVSRNQLLVSIDIYETVFTDTGDVKVTVSTSDGKILQRAKGKWKWHPKSFKPGSKVPEYPNWAIITMNNTREIYEQKQSGDIFSIVDETTIK